MKKNMRRFWRGGFLGALVCSLLSFSSAVLAENALGVGRGSARSGSVADIPLQLSGDGDVQGLQIIFEWDGSKASGVDVVANDGAGKPLNGAQLVEKRIENGFLIFAVVMDIDGQGGEKIRAGQGIDIGTAKIRCEGPSSGSRDIPLRLVDGKYARVDGGPLLSNLISIGGRSIGKGQGLSLRDGTLTCEGDVVETGKITFACGGGLDNEGKPTKITGPRESRHPVNFYYKAPGSADKIQGLSMAVSYSCDLTALEDTFSLEGGAIKEVDAEFVHLEVDNVNRTIDSDDCEFTLGVLIDAKSPFDGRTLPRTTGFKKLFSIELQIENDADCGKCYTIRFKDGLNGNGDVPVRNLVSVNFQSSKPDLCDCQICVEGGNPEFIRGDCNFSDVGALSVDIADAAAAVGYFFFSGDAKFNAPCDDACDANDDGRLDVADVVFILNYLFIPRSPKPPAPGPIGRGTDPTRDSLGCAGGRTEC